MPTPAEAPLDPSALARFGRLELIARLVVEGVMSGLHKSPFKGFSVEFAEHRQYGPGDEIRHIDWRALGKTDRYFVKEYEEETNLKAYLVLDSSGSMGYAGPDRLEVRVRPPARRVAGLPDDQPARRGRAGHASTTSSASMLPPRSAPGHFSALCRALEQTEVGGEAPLSGLLHALAERIKRRGLIVILSDGFDQLDDLTSALRHLRHRRHEVLFLHVLAPEEEEFPFRRPARFRDLETPAGRSGSTPRPSARPTWRSSRPSAATSRRPPAGWTPTTTGPRPPRPTTGPCSTTSPPDPAGDGAGADRR